MQIINLMRVFASIQIAFLLLNTGCSVGSKYNPPVTDIPQTWKNSTHIASDACYTDYWWEAFRRSPAQFTRTSRSFE